MGKPGKAERRWLKGTRQRTEDRHEANAALAAAGAASVLASGIIDIRETGAEAEIALRAGAILTVGVPGLGWVATIKAGDGWATAIISPRVLNGAPDTAGTGDKGDGQREPFTYGITERFVAGSYLAGLRQVPAPPAFMDPVCLVIRSVHPDWKPGQVNAEARRIYNEMTASEP